MTACAVDARDCSSPADPAAAPGPCAVGESHPRAADALAEALRQRFSGRVVVMGIGNPLRGDDGAGCLVARRLRRAFAWVPAGDPPGNDAAEAVAIVDAEEVPESYLDVLEAARPEVIVLVDAADLGGEPGSVTLLEGHDLQDRATYTHRTPLGPMASYLEQRTGARVLFAGIQPGSPTWGDDLSGEVAAAANRLAMIIWDALRPPPAEAPHAATPEAPVC